MIISSLIVRSRKAITRRRSTTPQYCGIMMLYPHNQVYNVILQFHFVLVIFLNLIYTFVSQTALFLGNCHSFKELLIPAAKIQIISENLVQLSENRTTLTILSINQCTILLKMAFFSIFQCLKIWLYPIFVLFLHPKTNDMRYR